MKKEKQEKDIIIRINTRFIIGLIVSLILIILLFFVIRFLLSIPDHCLDVYLCKKAVSPQLSLTDELDRCFANDDWNKLNFGKNIHCSCYYTGDYTPTFRGTMSKQFIIK